MERLLARLERTFLGRLAIEQLTTFIVGAMAVAYVLCLVRPEMREARLVKTQPWRVVSFLFVPPESSMIWVFFSLYWTWLVGSNLENEWGAFKFNTFYVVGALGTMAAAFISGAATGNEFLNLSLFLAFATIFPDYTIRLFFLIEIKVKWLALLSAAFLVFRAIGGDFGQRMAIGAAFANYFLFFGGHLVGMARGRRIMIRQAARRAQQRPQPDKPEEDARACAICGAKANDGADIRICNCEKCGGVPRELCLEHARNH
jgi:hypothetical protein